MKNFLPASFAVAFSVLAFGPVICSAEEQTPIEESAREKKAKLKQMFKTFREDYKNATILSAKLALLSDILNAKAPKSSNDFLTKYKGTIKIKILSLRKMLNDEFDIQMHKTYMDLVKIALTKFNDELDRKPIIENIVKLYGNANSVELLYEKELTKLVERNSKNPVEDFENQKSELQKDIEKARAIKNFIKENAPEAASPFLQLLQKNQASSSQQ
jgi:hypothetical protein